MIEFVNQIVIAAAVTEVASQTVEADVLKALSQIIDPDFGTDIVSCGFVKDLNVNKELGKVSQEIGFDELFICIILLDIQHSHFESQVSFRLELTTPACPVKDMVTVLHRTAYLFTNFRHSTLLVL